MPDASSWLDLLFGPLRRGYSLQIRVTLDLSDIASEDSAA